MNNNWFCIYTNAREEQIAFNELLIQGLKIYFPRYRRTIRHARKSQEKIFSLFPRYFFALELEAFYLSTSVPFSLTSKYAFMEFEWVKAAR